MKVIRFRERFHEVRKAYVGNRLTLGIRVFYYVDWFFAFIVHGASISDYFGYNFYKLRHCGRKEFVTYRRHRYIQNKCNPIIEERELCRNKIKFNLFFNNYLGRDWLDVRSSSLNDFITFFKEKEVVFVKEVDSCCGQNVRSYHSCDINPKKLYENLLEEKDKHYILEEKIVQKGELADFHPWSINTIRIVTIYDDIHDKVYLMNARLRLGNRKNDIDNLHAGGIGVEIDMESGILCSAGYDKNNESYLFHPETNKQIIGFQVPYWKECKEFIIEVARKVPTVRYIGWDIVSKGDGSFVLIEGNDNADHDIQQLHNCGLWNKYLTVIKEF